MKAASSNVCRRRLSILYFDTEIVIARHMKHHLSLNEAYSNSLWVITAAATSVLARRPEQSDEL
jgi:hypothetical protein